MTTTKRNAIAPLPKLRGVTPITLRYDRADHRGWPHVVKILGRAGPARCYSSACCTVGSCVHPGVMSSSSTIRRPNIPRRMLLPRSVSGSPKSGSTSRSSGPSSRPTKMPGAANGGDCRATGWSILTTTRRSGHAAIGAGERFSRNSSPGNRRCQPASPEPCTELHEAAYDRPVLGGLVREATYRQSTVGQVVQPSLGTLVRYVADGPYGVSG